MKRGISTQWTVLKHTTLSEVDDGLLTAVGIIRMPLMDFPRRMCVIRLRGKRVAIFSPIALSEIEMGRIEAMGSPDFLIVPSLHHRRDIKIWKDRYPKSQVIAPPGARTAVEEVVKVDRSDLNLDDPDVNLFAVPGTSEKEAGMTVRRNGRTSIIVSDIIGNLKKRRGFTGWAERIMGFSGKHPKVPVYARWRLIADRVAFRNWLTQSAQISGLERIIVAHGNIIVHDPANVLQQIAREME